MSTPPCSPRLGLPAPVSAAAGPAAAVPPPGAGSDSDSEAALDTFARPREAPLKNLLGPSAARLWPGVHHRRDAPKVVGTSDWRVKDPQAFVAADGTQGWRVSCKSSRFYRPIVLQTSAGGGRSGILFTSPHVRQGNRLYLVTGEFGVLLAVARAGGPLEVWSFDHDGGPSAYWGRWSYQQSLAGISVPYGDDEGISMVRDPAGRVLFYR